MNSIQGKFLFAVSYSVFLVQSGNSISASKGIIIIIIIFSGKQVTSSLARPEIHPSTSVANSTLIFNERAARVNPSGEDAKKVLNKIYIWRKIFFSNKCALRTA